MFPQAEYTEVEIRILERRQPGYPVEITVNNEREFPQGYLDPASLPWQAGADSAEEGERLFAWLCNDEAIRLAWAEVRSAYPLCRIRLRIDASAPELHALPWELLQEVRADQTPVNLAAAVATPFSRYLAGAWHPGGPILKRPLKILVVIPEPKNLAEAGLQPFSAKAEWENLQLAMSELLERGQVEMVRLAAPSTAGLRLRTREGDPVEIQASSTPPCTLLALEEELKQGYHILHFIGHGGFNPQDGTALIIMANAANEVEPVQERDFAAMLARQLADTSQLHDDKLRLVYLDSCASGSRDTANSFRGFAPTLVQAGVPAVIAMQDSIEVRTSQLFSRTFYRQLLAHGLVDLACNEARAAVLTAKLPGAAIPVLLMRLRNGQLLGQNGHVSSERAETFWPFLLENINRGQCTPFLGPQVLAGLLPDRATIAAKLAEKYGYPMPDTSNLARVAQYIALSDPLLLRAEYLRLLQRSIFVYLGIKPSEEQKRRFRDATLSETARSLDWSQQVLRLHEDEIHHVLAALELPLYLTTNIDNFLFAALQARGLQPRRVGPRWVQHQAGSPQWVLLPEPTPESPVIFHLNGCDEDDEQQAQLVLSEDDFLAHFVRLVRDQEQLLPANLLSMLAESSFLFLGYQLDDWEFRTILQSLMKSLAKTHPTRKMHVGVQLDPSQSPSEGKVREYLAQYLGQFQIAIYWGTSQQFASELAARWQAYQQTSIEEW